MLESQSWYEKGVELLMFYEALFFVESLFHPLSLPFQLRRANHFCELFYHFLLSKVNPRSSTLKPLHVYLFRDLIFYILSACLSLEGLFHPHLNVFIFLPLLNASKQSASSVSPHGDSLPSNFLPFFWGPSQRLAHAPFIP